MGCQFISPSFSSMSPSRFLGRTKLYVNGISKKTGIQWVWNLWPLFLIYNVLPLEPVLQMPFNVVLYFLPNGSKDEDSSDDVIAASPSLSEVFHEYVEHASIQGLNYLFLFTTSPFGKVFWCITVMAAVSQGFYWCDVTYQLWSTKPVITTIGSTSLPVQEARIYFS